MTALVVPRQLPVFLTCVSTAHLGVNSCAHMIGRGFDIKASPARKPLAGVPKR